MNRSTKESPSHHSKTKHLLPLDFGPSTSSRTASDYPSYRRQYSRKGCWIWASSSSHAFRQIHSSVMPLRWRGGWLGASSRKTALYRKSWFLLAIWAIWVASVSAMTEARIAELRQETVSMFYHGFDNYMTVAFPEDEVRSSVLALFCIQ